LHGVKSNYTEGTEIPELLGYHVLSTSNTASSTWSINGSNGLMTRTTIFSKNGVRPVISVSKYQMKLGNQ